MTEQTERQPSDNELQIQGRVAVCMCATTRRAFVVDVKPAGKVVSVCDGPVVGQGRLLGQLLLQRLDGQQQRVGLLAGQVHRAQHAVARVPVSIRI